MTKTKRRGKKISYSFSSEIRMLSGRIRKWIIIGRGGQAGGSLDILVETKCGRISLSRLALVSLGKELYKRKKQRGEVGRNFYQRGQRKLLLGEDSEGTEGDVGKGGNQPLLHLKSGIRL